MAHRNQRIIGPYHWKRENTSPAEVMAENPVGIVASVSSCPFVYKIVESRAIPLGGCMFEVSFLVEPASPQEAAAYLKHDWSANADREDQAMWRAAELRQASWYSGMPEEARVFCEAHQKLMPAHGSTSYDHALVCNACVEEIERALARGAISDPHVWIRERAAVALLSKTIDEIEARGWGCVQLGKRRYLELVVLYEYIRHSEYQSDARIEEHYPYKDMIPSMYHGYLREDWSPGEQFHAPTHTIVFTSRNKLMDCLESGKLPTKER